MMKLYTAILFLGALITTTASAPINDTRSATVNDSWSPTINDTWTGRELIPNRYIITLAPGVKNFDVEDHLSGVDALSNIGPRVWPRVVDRFSIGDFNAYVMEMDAYLIPIFMESSRVAHIEQDQIWRLSLPESKPPAKRAPVKQIQAPWGLGTISHRNPGSSEYIYDSTAGSGTFAYIVDTGLNTNHHEFFNRASYGFNAIGGPNIDGNGHGTHVAGTIGSVSFGVAKSTSLISVKCFDNSGSSSVSIILKGFEWAVKDIVDKGRQKKAVVNMSIGGPLSPAFNQAVKAAFQTGVLSIAAAGNDGTDAAQFSPGSAPEAITVSAVDTNWKFAPFSNYGKFVDLAAPGVNILSTWIGSETATNTISGTSMAAPHVSGLALYFMGYYSGLDSPSAVAALINYFTTGDKIGNIPANTVNHLAYNGNGA
ncbi:peptidase S8/S53 domain-containing protein [Xylariaceae sp. FL1019]|nr:peptidase S8/S53 domain-containing protein [Xylariaceae sp. FL1019]